MDLYEKWQGGDMYGTRFSSMSYQKREDVCALPLHVTGLGTTPFIPYVLLRTLFVMSHPSCLSCFACMFDEYLWRSYVYRTTFSNVKYQDLCATINPLKIKDLQKLKTISKYLCNNNLIGFLQKPDSKTVFLFQDI